VASHCRGEEALLSHLYGDEPSGNASSEFPHRRPFRIWLSARCIVAGVTTVDGRPERGRSDTLLCPCSDDVNRFVNGWLMLLSTVMST
jgi:hypothetical protein